MSKKKATEPVAAILDAHSEMAGDPYMLEHLEISNIEQYAPNAIRVVVAGIPDDVVIVNPPIYTEDPEGDHEPGDGRKYRFDPLYAVFESLTKHGGL